MIPLLCALVHVAIAAPIAFVGATLHPVSGPRIDDGVLLVEDEQILNIGARGGLAIPDNAVQLDSSGKHIIPGLVDSHSHIGGSRLNEALGPVQPGLSAVDAFDPTHTSVDRARAGGITTVHVMPGSGKLIGGQTAYLKLRRSSVVDDMMLCVDPPDGAALPARRGRCGGMKMANGTNPQGDGGDPKSRMGAAFLQRQALARGQQRLKALDNGPPAPHDPTDLDGDVLAEVVSGQRTVHFHTHRADDIATILALRREFGIDVVLHHVSEGWKVADAIAAAGLPCSLIVIDAPGGKPEAMQLSLQTGAILEQKGVPVAFHTDDPITDSRLFLRSAGLAVRGGMSPDGALRALTLTPAEMMHLDDTIGSLQPGKAADLVVLSGPPLSTWTRVEQTWVEGHKVFDRATPEGAALAAGGGADLALPEEPR